MKDARQALRLVRPKTAAPGKTPPPPAPSLLATYEKFRPEGFPKVLREFEAQQVEYAKRFAAWFAQQQQQVEAAKAEVAATPEAAPPKWSEVEDKPDRFPPEYHIHRADDFYGFDAMLKASFENVQELQESSTRAGLVWVNATRDDGAQEGAMFRRGSGTYSHDGVNVIVRYDGTPYLRCQ